MSPRGHAEDDDREDPAAENEEEDLDIEDVELIDDRPTEDDDEPFSAEAEDTDGEEVPEGLGVAVDDYSDDAEKPKSDDDEDDEEKEEEDDELDEDDDEVLDDDFQEAGEVDDDYEDFFDEDEF